MWSMLSYIFQPLECIPSQKPYSAEMVQAAIFLVSGSSTMYGRYSPVRHLDTPMHWDLNDEGHDQ